MVQWAVRKVLRKTPQCLLSRCQSSPQPAGTVFGHFPTDSSLDFQPRVGLRRFVKLNHWQSGLTTHLGLKETVLAEAGATLREQRT